MSVRIVTDSSADLPASLRAALGITVVPITVNIGAERLRDGVDIDHETFYRRLEESAIHPSTSQPTPQQFADAYAGIDPASEIVSIHAAEELSGTINAARQAASASPRRIAVIDGRSTSMGLGLTVLAAARLATAGASFDEVVATANREVAHAAVWFTVDTLEFLARGGRIGRAKRLLGAMLRIKPLLTVRNGAVEPVAQLRTRAQAVEALARHAEERRPLAALSVAYSTDAGAAQSLADELARRDLLPRDAILITRLGPAIGTHVGPGCLSVAVLQSSEGDAR
jgi:DegV family protein with EDD domain